MKSKTYLFDTNISVDILRGYQATIDKVNSLGESCLSVVVIGELYLGAHASNQFENKRIQVDDIIAELEILPITKEIAKRYSAVKDSLRRQGMTIPENDMWIAATALEHDLTVFTADKHFKTITGLKIEFWERARS